MSENHIELLRFAKPYPDTPVMPATRLALAYAIAHAERECVRYSEVREHDARLLVTNLDDDEATLKSLTVIRRPRYAASNREAPKRSTLFARLWRLLR